MRTHISGISGGVSLRAHHLLCLQGFQGYGYDSAFVRELSAIVMRLRSNPETVITIVSGADDVCIHCPNLENGVCTKEGDTENISLMDRSVMKDLGLASGNSFPASRMFEKANAAFPTKQSTEVVCGRCLWLQECLWMQNLAD